MWLYTQGSSGAAKSRAQSGKAAHDSGAAAASAVAATRCSVNALSRRLHAAQQAFSANIAASQQNQRLWPRVKGDNVANNNSDSNSDEDSDVNDALRHCPCTWCCDSAQRTQPPAEAVLLPSVSFAQHSTAADAHALSPCIATPCHALAPLLDYLARRAAASAAAAASATTASPPSSGVSLRHLVVLPSLAALVTVDDVVARLAQCSPATTAALHGLSIIAVHAQQQQHSMSDTRGDGVASVHDSDDEDDNDDTAAGTTGGTLTTLLAAMPQLTYLCLTSCNLRSALRGTLRSLLTREVAHVHIAGNDMGHVDGAVDALAQLLRRNKFLCTLDVASNGLDARDIARLARALATSNTTMTPEDVAATAASSSSRTHTRDKDKRSDNEDDESGDDDGEDDNDNDAVVTRQQQQQSTPSHEHAWAEQLLDRDMFVPPADDNDNNDEDDDGDADEGDDDADSQPDKDNDDDDDEGAMMHDEDDEDGEDAHEDDESAGDDDAHADEGDDANDDDDDDDDDEHADVAAAAAEAREHARQQREARQLARAQQRAVRRLLHDEASARRALLLGYVDATRNVLLDGLGAVRACAHAEQQRTTAAYCARRSGWSHLRALSLRDNAVGDDGARAVALALRSSVALTRRECTAQVTRLRACTAVLCDALLTARRATRATEARERAALMRAVAKAQQTTAATATSNDDDDDSHDGDEGDDDDEEDEFATEAPQVVLTNVDDGNDNKKKESNDNDGSSSIDGGDDDNNNSDDHNEDDNSDDNEDGDAAVLRVSDDAWQRVVLPNTTRPGWCALRHLDLGSGGIANSGLVALARMLATNTCLQSLVLRHNPLTRRATRHAKDGNDDEERGMHDAAVSRGRRHTRDGDKSSSSIDEGDADDTDADDVDEHGDGVAALANALRHNTSLRALDVAYCQLTAAHLRTLASAFDSQRHEDENEDKSKGKGNTTLQRLCLDGNGFVRATTSSSSSSQPPRDKCDDNDDAAGALVLLLRAITSSALSSSSSLSLCGVRCLGLAHIDGLARLLHAHNAVLHALAFACATTLTSLDVRHTGLCGAHVRRWAEAMARIAEQHASSSHNNNNSHHHDIGGDVHRSVCGGSMLTELYLSRNELAGVDDGVALGALLQQCPRLVRLDMADHPLLSARGVAAALAHAPHTLRVLGCARVTSSPSPPSLLSSCAAADADVSTAAADVQPSSAVTAVPPALLSQLHHVNWADVGGLTSAARVRDALAHCAQHGQQLRRLVLWSRDVCMADYLDNVVDMAARLPQLCYVDVGVLHRFDDAHHDDGDGLAALEQLLVTRRLALHA